MEAYTPDWSDMRLPQYSGDIKIGDNPCVTCRKKCLTIPKHGCAWWEPRLTAEPSQGEKGE